MARVYTSRIMLDPSVLQNMNNIAQQRYQNEAARKQAMSSSLRNLLYSAGKNIDEGIKSYQRAKEVAGETEYDNDPTYRAAKEEYIRTGSTSPLSQYVLQRETIKAREAEAAKRAEKEAEDKAWHDAVRLAEARPEYSKVLQNMYTAIDAGDYATADVYKNQLKAFETKFGADAFGNSAEEMAEARKKTAEAAAAKKALEERNERMMIASENLEKKEAEEKAAEQAKNALWLETQSIPTIEEKEIDEETKKPIPTAVKKQEAKEQVLRMLETNAISVDDANRLTKLIDSIETVEEAKKKAKKQAVATKTGEATGKAIDESTNKAEAAKYIGQKMNSLNYEDIPDNIRKYLKMDSKGIVGWK